MFLRDAAPSRKFDLAKWMASPVRPYAAVAQNLVADPHVSVEREQVFNRFLERLNGDWQRALFEYHAPRVRDARNPDYADHVLNGENILISGSALVAPRSPSPVSLH